MVLQMIDKGLMTRLIEMIEDGNITGVNSGTIISLRDELKNLEEIRQFIKILKYLKKEYYSFDVPEAINLSLVETDNDGISFMFYNNVRQRLWDITRVRDKFKGVLIEQPNTLEVVEVKFDGEFELPLIFTTLVRGASLPSHFNDRDTTFYQIHRGKDMQCHGGLHKSFFDNCMFSIELGLKSLIEGLATTNYDSPYATEPEELIKMFYLESNEADPREESISLEDEVRKQLPDISTTVNEISRELKKKTDTLHSYHKDCYCYYCTAIHLMIFNKDNIRCDSSAKVVISRRDFIEMFDDCLTGYEKKSLLYAIDKMKKYNRTNEVKYTPANTTPMDEFVLENLGDITDRFINENETDYEEITSYKEKRVELKERLDAKSETISSYIEIARELLAEKKNLTPDTAVEFLLTPADKDTDKRLQEIDERLNDIIKEREPLEEEHNEIKIKLDDIKEEMKEHWLYNFYRYQLGIINSSDVYRYYQSEFDSIGEDIRNNGNEGYAKREDFYFDNNKDKIFPSFLSYIDEPLENFDDNPLVVEGTRKRLSAEFYAELKASMVTTSDMATINEIYRRQNNFIDMGKVRGTLTTFLGVGTVCSNMAHTMSRFGFRAFYLVDFDVVETHNMPNQYYFKQDIGRKKAKTLSNNLMNVLPQGTNPLTFYDCCKIDELDFSENRVSKEVFIHSDIIFLGADSLLARYEGLTLAKNYAKARNRNYLIIDTRMNSLKEYVLYAFYINDEDKYKMFESTLIRDNQIIELEREEVCGLQSSIIVAQKANLKAIEIIINHLNDEPIPFMSTNIHS